MYKIYSTLTKNRIWLSTVHKHKSAIIKWTKLRWTRCIHWCNDMTWHRKSHLFKSTGRMKILHHIYTVLRHLYYSDNIVLLHYKTCTLYLSPAVTQHSFTITLLLSDKDVNILCEKKKRKVDYCWLAATLYCITVHLNPLLVCICSTKARQKRELCSFTKILRTWCSHKLCSNVEV